MKKATQATVKSSFIAGLFSTAGLVALIILNYLGPSSGLEALAMFYSSAFVCLPIIFIYGISSIIKGRGIETKGAIKWWLIPAGVTMLIVIGAPILIYCWMELTG